MIVHTARVAPEKRIHHPPAAVFSRGGQGDDMEFSQQYGHPKWQQRRLEKMQSVGFMCQVCFSAENQLHVHHKRYVRGRMLWQYEDFELDVLCRGCHDEAHREKELLMRVLARFPTNHWHTLACVLAGFAVGSKIDIGNDLAECYDAHAEQVGRAAAALSLRDIDHVMEVEAVATKLFLEEVAKHG